MRTAKIAKADLKHGAYYMGHCRNASIARWNGETSRFVYWRRKFGDVALDSPLPLTA